MWWLPVAAFLGLQALGADAAAASNLKLTFCKSYVTYEIDPILYQETGVFDNAARNIAGSDLIAYSGQRYDEWADAMLQARYNTLVQTLNDKGVPVCQSCLDAWKVAACQNFFPMMGFSSCLSTVVCTTSGADSCVNDDNAPNCGCGCKDKSGNDILYSTCMSNTANCDLASCQTKVASCPTVASDYTLCDQDSLPACDQYLAGFEQCAAFYQTCACGQLTDDTLSRACGHLSYTRKATNKWTAAACGVYDGSDTGFCAYANSTSPSTAGTKPLTGTTTTREHSRAHDRARDLARTRGAHGHASADAGSRHLQSGMTEALACVMIGPSASDVCLTFPDETLLQYPEIVAGAANVPSEDLQQVRNVAAVMPDNSKLSPNIELSTETLVAPRSGSYQVQVITNVEYIPGGGGDDDDSPASPIAAPLAALYASLATLVSVLLVIMA
eukprot:TRINITY_DN149_c0_g1::TRINITY_DN149_c0_g1_i1::g.14254::m.14254 TRINITY_DN149_c0_g1::TRINITY_DN149_c0_g1_i1::g.14254  ORF type:complete len:458 (-),score=139.94 TRINITY_DN149_c0_g1_i1:269-1597(-)